MTYDLGTVTVPRPLDPPFDRAAANRNHPPGALAPTVSVSPQSPGPPAAT